jgi:hypothetical protein
MLSQHLSAKRVYLAECNGLKPARSFEAKGETANSREQIEQPDHAALQNGRTSRRTFVVWQISSCSAQ